MSGNNFGVSGDGRRKPRAPRRYPGYTIKTFAVAVGASSNTIRKMVKRGEIEAVVLNGAAIIPPREFDRWNEIWGAHRETVDESLNRFTDEDDAVITADFNAYVPTEVMAAKLNRTNAVVRQRIFHMGLRRSHRASRTLEWAPEHLAKQLRSGELEAAQFVRLCHDWRDAERARVEQENAARNAEQEAELARKAAQIDAQDDLSRNDKIRAMRTLGMTLQEVADFYRMTRQRVQQISDPNYIPPKAQARIAPNEKLKRLEQRLARARLQVIEEAIAALVDLWKGSPPEAQQKFRQQILAEEVQR